MSLTFRDLGIGSTLTDYREAWDQQRALHAGVVAGTESDSCLLLEHEAVYTAGKRTLAHDRPTDGTPVVDVDRGGSITWHGPGQLVAYPIVRLPEGHYVVDFVRRVEEAMIQMLNRDFGLTTGRIEGRSGAWLAASGGRPDRKIAQIGIRVAQHVTMHGLAINADPDMGWADKIIPCGISDAGTTSIAAELGRPVSVAEVAEALQPHLTTYLAFEPYEMSAPLTAGLVAATGAGGPGAGAVTYGVRVPSGTGA
ncbi:MAG: lipoyl(octanoyl) transferase LipB [Propionibacteriaceae bacterium]